MEVIDSVYPPFSELNIAPDFLLIGASAMRNLRTYGYLGSAPLAHERAPRVATSIYKGVSRHNGGYSASYKIGEKWVRGKSRETELEAARDYAAAMGRTELELR